MQPDLILTPFGKNATTETISPIPEARSPGDPRNKATWDDGFPLVTMTPIGSGGIPPKGQDLNGVLNALSEQSVYTGGGGQYQWSSAYVSKNGGYQKGAVIQSNDGLNSYVSLVDDNTTDFNSAPSSIGTSWGFYSGTYLSSDEGSSGIGYLSPLAVAVGRTIREKASDFVSLKDFGCKGDGITDDTANYIKAVVNAGLLGHALYAPKGDYILSGDILIAAAGVKTYGDGQRNTNFIFTSGGFTVNQTSLAIIRRPVKFSDLSILTRTSKTDVAISATGNPSLRYGQGVLLTNVEFNGESSSNTWYKHVSLNRCGMSIFDGCVFSGGGTSKANRVSNSIELIGSKDVKIINGAIINFDDGILCTDDAEGVVVSNNHIIAGIRGFISDNNVGNYFAINNNHFAVGQEAVILGSGASASGSNHAHVHDNFVIPWPAPDAGLTEWIAFKIYSSFNMVHNNQVLKTGVSFSCTAVALKTSVSRSAANNTIDDNIWNAVTRGVVIDAGCTTNRIRLNHRIGLTRADEVVDNGTGTIFIGTDSDGYFNTWAGIKFQKPGVAGQKQINFHTFGGDIADSSIIATGGSGAAGSGSITINASQLNLGKVALSAPFLPASYTLSTLPVATLFPGSLITVMDAAGGAKVCRSGSGVWQILNTTTTVS